MKSSKVDIEGVSQENIQEYRNIKLFDGATYYAQDNEKIIDYKITDQGDITLLVALLKPETENF